MDRTLYSKLLNLKISAFRTIVLTMREAHNVPFFSQYEKVTGQKLSAGKMLKLKKNHRKLISATAEHLNKSQAALEHAGIPALEAWHYPSLLLRNRYYIISHYEVLRECGFIRITAQLMLRYLTYMNLTKISELKVKNLIPSDLNMHKHLLTNLKTWPAACPAPGQLCESTSTVTEVRLNLLRQYLDGKKLVPKENFEKINVRFKHKSFANIEEVIHLSENEYGMSIDWIKRHISHLLSVSAGNARDVLQLEQLAGLDIRTVVRMMPAILINDCEHILKISDILKEYKVPDYEQRRSLQVFCMSPQTVEDRLRLLSTHREIATLSTNPRALLFVVYYHKILKRIELFKQQKQNYSLSLLLRSRSKFERFTSGLENSNCSRDIAYIIYSNLNLDPSKLMPLSDQVETERITQTGSGESIRKYTNQKIDSLIRYINKMISRHSLWMHASHSTVYDNILLLRQHFSDESIFRQCQIVLYPKEKLNNTVTLLKEQRTSNSPHPLLHPDLNFSLISNDQLLSLVFYVIEKEHNFSDNGIWSVPDRTEAGQNSNISTEDALCEV